jgi:hypothetical protein
MVFIGGLVIFALITVVIWFVAVALYNLLTRTDLHQSHHFGASASVAIFLVTLLSFVPFPWGYFLSLGVWALTAWGMLELPRLRGGLLFVLLAVLSFVARLAALGALNY